MTNLDEELGNDYLTECREHLAAIETGLTQAAAGHSEIDEDLVNRAFRAVHSVRGAGFFNLAALRDLAHQTEQMLDLLRGHKIAPTPRRTRVLLRAIGALQSLMTDPTPGNLAGSVEIADALARICADHHGSTETVTRYVEHPAGKEPARLRMLLVEDDFASRIVLQTFLSRYGECYVAVNGKEAVDAFRTATEQGMRYDLICMDIMMPEMDGREAVRQIRAIEEAGGILSTVGAKIFMTTAVDDIREVARCFGELADAYILKPIDLNQLLSRLKSFHLIA